MSTERHVRRDVLLVVEVVLVTSETIGLHNELPLGLGGYQQRDMVWHT